MKFILHFVGLIIQAEDLITRDGLRSNTGICEIHENSRYIITRELCKNLRSLDLLSALTFLLLPVVSRG